MAQVAVFFARTRDAHEVEQDFAVYRDVYRDAFGSRPRGDTAERFLAMNAAERRAELESVYAVAEAEMQREEDAELQAFVSLWTWLHDEAAALNVTPAQLLRWEFESEQDGDILEWPKALKQEFSYWCYTRHIHSFDREAQLWALYQEAK